MAIVLDLEHDGTGYLVQFACQVYLTDASFSFFAFGAAEDYIIKGAQQYSFKGIQLKVTLQETRDQGCPLERVYATLSALFKEAQKSKHDVLLVGHGVHGDIATLKRSWMQYTRRGKFLFCMQQLAKAATFCLADYGEKLGLWLNKYGQPKKPKLAELVKHFLPNTCFDHTAPHCAVEDVEVTSQLFQLLAPQSLPNGDVELPHLEEDDVD
jgi:hypothetical protein